MEKYYYLQAPTYINITLTATKWIASLKIFILKTNFLPNYL